MCILPSFFKIGPKLITMSMEDRYFTCTILGFPEASDDEESACSAGDPASIPGSGRSPGEGNGNPLQYSCLENPMDRGAWWAIQFMGSQTVGHDWATNPFTFYHLLLLYTLTFSITKYLFVWPHQVLVAALNLQWGQRAALDVAHNLNCPKAFGILVPQPRIKPTSPALEDRFLTTGPPGKSHIFLSLKIYFQISDEILIKAWRHLSG